VSKELVEYIARALADEPEEVEVHAADDKVLELRLAPDDVGKVIGRGGRIARALRTVVRAGAVREHRRVSGSLADPRQIGSG